MEQSREEFEKWLKFELPTTWRLAYGDIEDGEDELVDAAKASILEMRLAWQASRSAVVVELPDDQLTEVDTYDRAFNDGYRESISDCRSIIEAQGLTVK